MNIEVGQIWRLNSGTSTYIIKRVFAWNVQGTEHRGVDLERLGEPDPDFLRTWKEHVTVLEENYYQVTDEDEIGWLLLQNEAA